MKELLLIYARAQELALASGTKVLKPLKLIQMGYMYVQGTEFNCQNERMKVTKKKERKRDKILFSFITLLTYSDSNHVDIYKNTFTWHLKDKTHGFGCWFIHSGKASSVIIGTHKRFQ